MKKTLYRLLSLAIAALTLNACYVKEDIPFVPSEEKTPASYVVTIRVVDSKNFDPLDASLPFSGIESDRLRRISTGLYEYTPSLPGNYNITVSAPDYDPAVGIVSIPRGEANEVITCSVIVVLQKKVVTTVEENYLIWGTVVDGKDNTPLKPSYVTCKIREGLEAPNVLLTDNTFKVSVHTAGMYDLKISAPGYDTVRLTQVIQKVSSGNTIHYDLTVPMFQSGTVKGEYYSIRGTVMDAQRNVKTGATLSATLNGSTTLYELPNGTYQLNGLKADQQVSCIFNADGCYPSALNFSLPSFTGTPHITYDVFLNPVPANLAVKSQTILPLSDGSLGGDISLRTPEAPLLNHQPSAIYSSINIPQQSILRNNQGDPLNAPFSLILTTASQLLTAYQTESTVNLGTSLFRVKLEPLGLTPNTSMTLSVRNPFGSLKVDKTYLSLNTEVGTRSLLPPGSLMTFAQVDGTYVLNTNLAQGGDYIGYTAPIAAPIIGTDLTNDGQYAESFYNRTGISLNDVVYEYYAKSGNVYAPGFTPEEVVEAADISYQNSEEKAFLAEYVKACVRALLGETQYSLSPVRKTWSTGVSCASNQYLNTTTSYKYSERSCLIVVTDAEGKTANLLVKVRNYVTSSVFDVELYDASHTTGSEIRNNGAGGGYGSSNL